MNNLCSALAATVISAILLAVPAASQESADSAAETAIADPRYDDDVTPTSNIEPPASLCRRVLAQRSPEAAYTVTEEDQLPEPEPGLSHPALAYESMAARLSLLERQQAGAATYRLIVDVISDEPAADLRLTLIMPRQIEVSGLDGQLLLQGFRPGYLAATPEVEYADYRLDGSGAVGKSGLRRYRFDLGNLPELGQIEVTVRGRALFEPHPLHSYARINFGRYAPPGEGPPKLYASRLTPQQVVRRQLWQACSAADDTGIARSYELLQRLDYGGASYPPKLSAGSLTTAPYCLQGRLVFSDVQAQQHPVAGAEVQLIKGTVDTGAVLITGQTDASGHFKLEFPLAPENLQALLNLQFNARGEFSSVYKADQIAPGSPVWSIGLMESAASPVDIAAALEPGKCVDVGSVIADSAAHQENNYAFSIFSALNQAGGVSHQVLAAVDHLATVYPNPMQSGLLQAVSLFRADNGSGLPSILVAPLDPHNWDILHHEHAHYIQHVRTFPAPPGKAHSVYQNHCTSEAKSEAIRFGWFEAWPTAMGMTVQKNLPAAYDTVPTNKDGAYSRQDLDGSALFDVHFDPDSIALPSYASESTEFVLTSALWETYDGATFQASYQPPPAGQTVSAGFLDWVDLTGQPAINHFSDFSKLVLPAFVANSQFDSRIGALLARHRVAPALTQDGPEQKLRSRWLFAMTNGPNCDALTPDFRVRYFMRVYSKDYLTIVWESAHGDSPLVATPVGAMKTFLTGSGDTLHWHPGAVHPCKESGGACDPMAASNPDTGEYLGEAWTMVDSEALCPGWLVYLLIALLLLLLVVLAAMLFSGFKLVLLIIALLALAVLTYLLYWYWYCLFG